MNLQTIVAITCIICITQSQPIYHGIAELESFSDLDILAYVEMIIDYVEDVVDITFVGHDPVWNGIGFGQVMNNSYAIITDYGEVERVIYESILGDHNSGVYIEDGVIGRISDTTSGTQRSVRMARPINATYYSFPPNPETARMEIPMIAALGTSIGFYLPNARHRAIEQFTLSLERIGTTSAPLITSTATESTTTETEETVSTAMNVTETTETALNVTESFETTDLVDVCCECVSKHSHPQMKHHHDHYKYKPWYYKPWKKYSQIQSDSESSEEVEEAYHKWHKSPGCEDDTACENIICERDPYCCDRRWDKICRIQASRVCAGEELPKCCGCSYKTNEKVVGCETDEACEEEICGIDAFCCGGDEEGAGYWDHKCRKKAKHICKEVEMEKVDEDNVEVNE